jgi:hypothetical protein
VWESLKKKEVCILKKGKKEGQQRQKNSERLACDFWPALPSLGRQPSGLNLLLLGLKAKVAQTGFSGLNRHVKRIMKGDPTLESDRRNSHGA